MEAELDALIQRADSADPAAADQLFTLLYHELHQVAERSLRRANGIATLGTTTLLHETYLNISERRGATFTDQARFLAYASRAMRGLVIDYARRNRALKRGRQFEITLTGDDSLQHIAMQQPESLEELGDAVAELTRLDPALAELVDMHFFCGFTFAEIANLRGVSERTVQRDWRKARLLLQHALLDDAPDTPGAP
jgi:RNA polymerase sigma factor (TIGR02999 family)